VLGTPVSLLIGLILILGSVGLFFLDKIRPTYARDSDKVYAVFILIAGILALTHWEINIGESFQMLLMAGMLTTLMIENIRTREPKLPVPTQPLDNRPPRPQYRPAAAAAPPVRRGYRAELDNRAAQPPGFRGDPARAPRMAPAQAEYWSDAPRAPYEEYRGPAGRLQPSPNGSPAPKEQMGREQMGREQMSREQMNRVNDRYADGNGRYGERPPAARPPEQMNPSQNETNGWASDSRQRSSATAPMNRGMNGENGGNSSRPNGDRALNVRPLSEAPKIDLPAENA